MQAASDFPSPALRSVAKEMNYLVVHALRVVIVVLGASALGTFSWTCPIDTTALSVESLGACRTRRASWAAVAGLGGCGSLGSGGSGSSGFGCGGSCDWLWGCGGGSGGGSSGCGSEGGGGGGSLGGSGSGSWVGLTAAAHWGWTGDGVNTAIVIWLTAASVDANLDTSIVLWVSAREGNGRTTVVSTTTADIDLNAGDVELSTEVVVGAVQSDQFGAEEVVSWGETGWESKVPPTISVDQGVDSPFLGGGVETLVGDFEPLEACGRGSGGVVDLGKVNGDWALVGRSNRVVNVSWILLAPDNVTPVCADLCTSWDGNDGGRCGSGNLADDIVGGNVHDGVVASGCSEPIQLSLLNPIDR